MATQPLFLRNIWYYALPSKQLKPGKRLVKTLLNEPIVFGRTQTGTVLALRDTQSAVHKQNSEIAQVQASDYPVREAQGNVWIYMTDDDRSIPQEDVPQVPEFGDQSYQAIQVIRFPCDIDHAVVGLIDPSHIAFVHRAWWWRSPATLAEVVKIFDPSLHGFTMRRHPLEQQTFFYQLIGTNPQVEISFRLPGIRLEQISTDQHTVCNLTAITPISDTETEETTLFYTTIPWFPLLKPLLMAFTRSFLNQDRRILIKQQIGLKYDSPLTLVGDADAQARWYYRLKAEFARAKQQGRPFINPLKERILHWRS